MTDYTYADAGLTNFHCCGKLPRGCMERLRPGLRRRFVIFAYQKILIARHFYYFIAQIIPEASNG